MSDNDFDRQQSGQDARDSYVAQPSDGKLESDTGQMEPDQITPDQRRGLVGYVSFVGTMMIVQGIFEFIAGVGFLGIAVFAPQYIVEAAETNPLVQEAGLTPEQLMQLTIAIYGTMGCVTLLLGLLSIFAGVKTLQFRSHTLSVVSLCAQLMTLLFGCYCFPTAAIIGICGLIVLLNSPVKTAFGLANAGWSPNKIKETFKSLPA